jgi:hypothetical protein
MLEYIGGILAIAVAFAFGEALYEFVLLPLVCKVKYDWRRK